MQNWKDLSVFGYPEYEINTEGICINPKGKQVTITRCGNGLYPTINVSKNGKQKQLRLHVVLATLFIPNPNKLPEVNHKDGNKENWDLNNLEWITHKDNMQHACHTGLLKNPAGEQHPSAKLTALQVQEIRDTYIRGSKTHGSSALGKKYGVHYSMILRIVNNKNWLR